MITKYKLNIILACFVCILHSACKKFVQIPPPSTSLTTKTVFTTDATAQAAIIGIYERMSRSADRYSGGANSITYLTGLSSDEFKVISGDPQLLEFNQNQLAPGNGLCPTLWRYLYEDIYATNIILEGLEISNSVSESIKTQIAGEARFLRAFYYFYLTNLWGKVPLIIGSDYKVNLVAGRADVTAVYNQIIEDLNIAKESLPEQYIHPERSRPNKYAASALLARVYLYLHNWEKAEAESSIVINAGSVYNLENNLDSVFLKASKEVIWNLQVVAPGYATFDGLEFVFTGSQRNVALNEQINDLFEPQDARQLKWINNRTYGTDTYYYPFKYKLRLLTSITAPSPEYTVFLRLAEQFLIRAEARTQLNNIEEAKEDINKVRTRAGLGNISTADQASLLNALITENRIEFMSEWGHRWFDLKRWQKLDDVIGGLKGATWQSTDSLYPIPLDEIILNPKMTQNEGYF